MTWRKGAMLIAVLASVSVARGAEPPTLKFEKIIGERMAYWRGLRERHKKKEG